MATAAGGEGRSDRWERLACVGGLGFLGTVALGAVVIGETSPSSQAPAAEIAGYFVEHQRAVLFNSILVTFGAFVLFPMFLVGLWRTLRRMDGPDGMGATLALIAGITLPGPLLVQAVGWGAAALHAGADRDPWVAAALTDLGDMGFLLFPLPAGLLVAATSRAARGGARFPSWLVRAGTVLAVVLVAGALTVPGLAPVSFVLFGSWLVATTVVLVRTGGRGRGRRVER